MADKQKTGRNWKTPKQKKKLAKLLSEGAPVGEALRQAGWSELQSKKGYATVPNDVLALLPKKTKALMDKGRALKADKSAMENLILGRLGENIARGRDAGTQSAKVLGTHRDLNMWPPDQLAGVIILETPQRLRDPEVLKKMLETEE
jgi:hypothetical protein